MRIVHSYMVLALCALLSANAAAEEVCDCTGEIIKYDFSFDGCAISSFTAKYKVSHFFGEPTVNGAYQWEASGTTPANCLPYDTTVWLQIVNDTSSGYIRLSPTVSEAGTGYGMNVTGSPNWNNFICGFDGTMATTCLDPASAKALYKGGRITDFILASNQQIGSSRHSPAITSTTSVMHHRPAYGVLHHTSYPRSQIIYMPGSNTPAPTNNMPPSTSGNENNQNSGTTDTRRRTQKQPKEKLKENKTQRDSRQVNEQERENKKERLSKEERQARKEARLAKKQEREEKRANGETRKKEKLSKEERQARNEARLAKKQEREEKMANRETSKKEKLSREERKQRKEARLAKKQDGGDKKQAREEKRAKKEARLAKRHAKENRKKEEDE